MPINLQLAMFFGAIMVAALNAKMLGPAIIFALGLTVAGDEGHFWFLFIAFLASIVASNFRD